MTCLSRDEAIARMDQLAAQGVPYVFVVDYDGCKAYVEPMTAIDPTVMMYSLGRAANIPEDAQPTTCTPQWSFEHPDRAQYSRSFTSVVQQIKAGNSYLVNLTCRVPIDTNLSMRDIFLRATAKYRLWIADQLVCFSPETFVKVQGDTISSFPMKGTIDATLPHAQETLENDPKEMAEHATIVDLIRNDLSMVAYDVEVERYRYTERIATHRGAILQTSSEIKGRLQPFYRSRPGSMLQRLLPAGSITGAPKPKTMDIIRRAEGYDRGFYTGVMGVWENGNMDSAVMIRFIDKENDRLYYKAGGGITAKSEEDKEYQEIIDKIYVPIR